MPPVHRDTDSRSCGATTKAIGQGSVFINGLLASVKDDPDSHIAGLLTADNNQGALFIEGNLVVLVGSAASPDLLGHVNPLAASGSPNVFSSGTPGGAAASGGGSTAGAPADATTLSPTPDEPVDTAEPTPEPEPTPVDGDVTTFQESKLDALNLGAEEKSQIASEIARYQSEYGIDVYPIKSNTGEVLLVTNPLTTDTQYGKMPENYTPIEAQSVLSDLSMRFPTKPEYDALARQADTRQQFAPQGAAYAIGLPQAQTQQDNFRSTYSEKGYGFTGEQGLTALGTKVYVSGGKIYGGSFSGSPDRIIQPVSGIHGNGYADYSHGTVGVKQTGIFAR